MGALSPTLSFFSCRQVVVEIGGRRKMTAEAKGEEDIRSEETLDFLIGGEVVDREGEMVKVEVWDVTFVASDLVRLAINTFLCQPLICRQPVNYLQAESSLDGSTAMPASRAGVHCLGLRN